MLGIARKMRAHAVLRSLGLIGTLRRRLLGPYGAAILSHTENGLLLVPPGDMSVGRKLCFSGSYDHEDLETLLSACDDESRVLVVGAHVGALAVPIARKAKHVTAVEANPATFELLRMNVLLNSLQNVDVHNFAAGDRAETVAMLASRVNSGGSKLKMGEWERWIYTYDRPETVTVQMQRLDEVFPDSAFDLIVMDIEGSEAVALLGMPKLLSRCRVLMVEIVEHHLRNIARVSNDGFVNLLAPHFDVALILPEASKADAPGAAKRYPRSAFSKMMTECCRRGEANVLFGKTLSPLAQVERSQNGKSEPAGRGSRRAEQG